MDKEIIKIATYPDAKHFLALSADGNVFSWGCGDGGRLGLGDSTSRDQPTLIETLSGKNITQIVCGTTYRYVGNCLVVQFCSQNVRKIRKLRIVIVIA